MKKLLVLLMILGLATSAQATLSLTTDIFFGGPLAACTGHIYVNSTNNEPWQAYFVLSEDLVNWTDPIAAAYYGSWSYHTTAGPGSVGDLGFATPVSGYSAAYFLNANGTTVLPQAGTQFSINIEGVQLGTIYVGLQDPTTYEDLASPLTFFPCVPEPTTMALLGLGGLALLRRSKGMRAEPRQLRVVHIKSNQRTQCAP